MITDFKLINGGCKYYVGNIDVSVKYRNDNAKHYFYIKTYSKKEAVEVARYISTNMMYQCECEYMYLSTGSDAPLHLESKDFESGEEYFLVDESGLESYSTTPQEGNHYLLLNPKIIKYSAVCDMAIQWYHTGDYSRIIAFSDSVSKLNKAGYNVDVICRMTNSGCYDILHITLEGGDKQ